MAARCGAAVDRCVAVHELRERFGNIFTMQLGWSAGIGIADPDMYVCARCLRARREKHGSADMVDAMR